jgi:predicted DNA-binding transcriptional regulator AlpA
MTMRTLPYPPPWQDIGTLAAHVSASPNTIENWVAKGILPQPVKRGGKLMWKWEQVDDWLTNGPPGSPDAEAERIRNDTRRAAETRPGH